jgi:6-pyruvoyltetrahydropterin/6-carboxytetrahydropterin synthase
MNNIRVSKKFTFDLAHALLNYDGLCKNIHGHTYTLTITLIGKPYHLQNDSKDGMVVDFSEIKKIVQSQIISKFDHALVLNENSNPNLIASLKECAYKIVFTKFQPSCENLLIDIKDELMPLFTNNATLYAIRLDETPTSYAEWFINDQV